MIRPSHGIMWLSGIFTALAHADRDAAMFWGAIGIAATALWSAFWEERP